MKPLLDVKSAAMTLGISPWTVRSFISKGKLTAVRLGRRVLLEQAELETLISRGRAPRLENAADAKERV